MPLRANRLSRTIGCRSGRMVAVVGVQVGRPGDRATMSSSSSVAIIRTVGKYGHAGHRRIWVNDNGCAAAAATIRRLLLLSAAAAASASTPGLFACCNGGRRHRGRADSVLPTVARIRRTPRSTCSSPFSAVHVPVYIAGSHPAGRRAVMILYKLFSALRRWHGTVGIITCPSSRRPLRTIIVRWRVTRYCCVYT